MKAGLALLLLILAYASTANPSDYALAGVTVFVGLILLAETFWPER